MAVKITPTVANTYLVNDVELYQDSENNWLSRGELTTEETTAFLNYIEPITVQKKNNSKQQLFDLERLKKELKGNVFHYISSLCIVMLCLATCSSLLFFIASAVRMLLPDFEKHKS